MTQTMEAFRHFYEVTRQAISVAEAMAGESDAFLKSGYPSTKEELLSLRFSTIPGCDEVLKLGAALLPIEFFPGYEDVRSLAVELISRMIVVARVFEDIQKVFSTYGYTPDTLMFSQLKTTMAAAVRDLQYTLEEFRTLHLEKSWKLFEPITNLIPEVENAGEVGRWVFNQEPRTPGVPTPAPYVHYEELPFRVLDAVYEFVKDHPQYQLPDGYRTVLQDNGITWSGRGMREANISAMDDQCVLALIFGVSNAERFSDGTLKRFFHNGCMLRWLKRLDEIDSTF